MIKTLLCVAVLALGPVMAEIVEIGSLEEVQSYASDGCMVLFDIDDTLICYPSHLGSECWFEEARRTLPSAEFHQVAGLLARKLQVTTVEPCAARVIEELQKGGYGVWGVTSREPHHPAVEDWMGKTEEQLASVGIQFHQDVIFTGWGRKGPILSVWVQERAIPAQLILVDDRLSDLQDVEAAMQTLGIPYLGLWYRAIEERRQAYDSEIAQAELDTLIGLEGVHKTTNVDLRTPQPVSDLPSTKRHMSFCGR